MFEEYIGVIKMFAGNYAPRGYAFCDGRLLSIMDHQTLYSILGNSYGGDGKKTFALPDLRGRIPIGQGYSPGLVRKKIGEKGGQEKTILQEKNMPAHSHPLNSNSAAGTSNNPHNNFPALSGVKVNPVKPPYAVKVYSSAYDTQMHARSIGLSGENEPFDNMPPYQSISFIICMDGIYPGRA